MDPEQLARMQQQAAPPSAQQFGTQAPYQLPDPRQRLMQAMMAGQPGMAGQGAVPGAMPAVAGPAYAAGGMMGYG